MAVSGADWRKSTDGYRTETGYEACPVRSDPDGFPAASRRRIDEYGGGAARTLAENTDRIGNEASLNTVETDRRLVSEPLAIGALEAASVTEWPAGGNATNMENASTETAHPAGHNLGEDRIYLRYFTPAPETRRNAVISG